MDSITPLFTPFTSSTSRVADVTNTLPHATRVGSLEEALGYHTSYLTSRARVADQVEALLAMKKAGRQLTTSLTSWLASRHDRAACDASLAFIDQWLSREGAFDGDIKALGESASLLPKLSLWTLAKDGWGAGSDTPGLHAFLASGGDTNVLLAASLPSLDAPPTPTTPPRRDMGLYALNYGGVYVASCSPATHPEQAAAAMAAADSFPGPSLVVCLAAPTPGEAAAAVDSGAWPLYRWDPRLDGASSTSSAFTLDSPKLRKDLADFVARDSHFALLASPSGGVGGGGEEEEKKEEGGADAAAAPAALQSSFSRLMGALQLPPLHIRFASDGGNAEGVAKRLGAEAKRRGFPSVSIATLDSVVAEGEGKEGGVVGVMGDWKAALFVVSTAGQGEYPVNGRAFAKALDAAAASASASATAATTGTSATPSPSAPGPLSHLNYAVFGLGDSHYWPRKEHAHFFNSPSIHLHTTLGAPALGAVPMYGRGSGDDQSTGGYNADLKAWLPGLWSALGVGLPEDAGGGGGGCPQGPRPRGHQAHLQLPAGHHCPGPHGHLHGRPVLRGHHPHKVPWHLPAG